MGSTFSTGIPPLHAAAKEGKHDLVQQLLAAGADVDTNYKGMTPLHQAVEAGQNEVVQVLLAAGADVHAKMPDGSTALHIAAKTGSHNVVQQLLTAGADLEPVLGTAASAGHANVAHLLLAAGTKAEAAGPEFISPFHAAARLGHTGVIRVLLEAGANVKATDSSGTTPLFIAAIGGHHEVVQLLLAAGANVDEAGDCLASQFGILEATVVAGHVQVMQCLLSNAASIPPRAARQSAVDLSAMKGNAAMVQLLLEAWGQPPITASQLVRAAEIAVTCDAMDVFAQLAKELWKLHPAELQLMSNAGGRMFCLLQTSDALEVVLGAWAADVSSLDEQQAALCKREDELDKKKQAVQQLVVAVAGIAKVAQQESVAKPEGPESENDVQQALSELAVGV